MKIAIMYLHFGAGHIAQMEAWYQLCSSLGHTVCLYVHAGFKNYLDALQYRILKDEAELANFAPDLVVMSNCDLQNVRMARKCKKMHSKLIYILHEPYPGIVGTLKEGEDAYKRAAVSLINYQVCSLADRVLVCSEYAKKNVSLYMRRVRPKTEVFPLIFLDNFDPQKEQPRTFFSMVGAYCPNHGSDRFLAFAKQAYRTREPIRFRIGMRTAIKEKLQAPILQEMIKTGYLTVQEGRPLTEEEFDSICRSSICIWNVYILSTQSGVFPNAIMQGTPVIATHVGSFDEFVVPGCNGEFVENDSFEEIYNAYRKIESNLPKYEKGSRDYFLQHCYYGSQKDRLQRLLESL